ncbi:monovalent cation/H(+) antiporter subunit G [Camelimonas abortus]|uniref:Monovalent cation/H(+) antiporter subunit G n=1 Tax=Camelimonas abortus TaxID=1017184 RepID=A0ABV7LAM7_9HYPH
MIAIHALPAWAALLVALLTLAGAALTLTGTVGLLRLRTFYERVHAPTLGATLGLGFILLGSMLYFSVSETRPVVHEILIGVFVTVTTPVTMLMLTQAALYRDRAEGKAPKSTDAPPLVKDKAPPLEEILPGGLPADPGHTK